MNSIKITEVGLRDGLQSLPFILPTDKKLKILRLISDAGIDSVELTSFVSAAKIPQMADSKDVSLHALGSDEYNHILFSTLIPNKKGAEIAHNVGYKHLRFFVSASETHNQKNTRQSIDKSLQQLETICESFPDTEISVIIATAFGCPFEGTLPPKKVLSVAEKCLTCGAKHVGLADTYGHANSQEFKNILKEYLSEFKIPPFLHLHNFNGNGYTNLLSALDYDVIAFDTAFSGLGGCPAIDDFNGNLSTEKVFSLLSKQDSSFVYDSEIFEQNYKKIARIIQSSQQ